MPRMSMGTRETNQSPLWIAASDLPASPGHPFYARLNAILDAHGFDRFVEDLCRRFYAPVMGRPSLTPGRYLRLCWSAISKASMPNAASPGARRTRWRSGTFLRLPLHEAAPDHSTRLAPELIMIVLEQATRQHSRLA